MTGGHVVLEGREVRGRGDPRSEGRGVTLFLALLVLVVSGFVGVVSSASAERQEGHSTVSATTGSSATSWDMIQRGRTTFRHDTFGNEEFWGGKLRLHQAIRERRGGRPTTALAVGLKVDVEALPESWSRVSEGARWTSRIRPRRSLS